MRELNGSDDNMIIPHPDSNYNEDKFKKHSGNDFNSQKAWTPSPPPPDAGEKIPVIQQEVHRKPGCWGSFSSCIGGIWATRQMTSSANREVYVRTTIRELIIYMMFLIILCILTFGMSSSTMFYYTKVLQDLFLDGSFDNPGQSTFRTSTQMADFWTFTDTAMSKGLYWDYWYDENSKVKNVSEQDRNILYENKLLGVPRLRQLRVLNNSCYVHEDFQKVILDCYDNYYPAIENKEPFGLQNSTEWIYHTENNLDGSTYWGRLSSYSGAGFYKDLSQYKEETKNIMAKLKKNMWLDRSTRVIFLDFTVYNANINLFCVVKLVFEFPASGGMLPSSSFRTVKLLRYVTALDYFVLSCEGIFVLFVCYYIVEEMIEIKRAKCQYFKSIWNILDLLVIFISLLCVGFSVFRYLLVNQKLQGLLQYPKEFANFEFLGFWQTQFNNVVALCVFFAWIKLFKYISFNKTMTQLSSTLSRCAKDVAGFAIMFFIVFFAFAQLGYLLFGTQVQDFSTFGDAVFTLLRTILGDFNFHEIEAANRVLGPIFFLSYVFFVFFVLLNMFLAIINDTYSAVKEEISAQKNEFEIADYFRRGYNNMMGKLGRRDKLVDIENALKLAAADNVVSYEEIRQNMRKSNFSDLEIEMFLSRFETMLDGKELTREDTERMLGDLEGERLELEKSIRNEAETGQSRPSTGRVRVTYDEFAVLQRRVDRMEHSISSIVSKIDAVLVKMGYIEKAKNKRRDQFSKMIDTLAEDKEGERE